MEHTMDEAKVKSYTADSKKWEDGTLGEEEQFVAVADETAQAALDDALKLQMISIRLPKQMIEDLKLIARAHGIGYQPLIRDLLGRFITHEWKAIIRDTLERREQEDKRCQEEAEKAQEVISEYQQKLVA